jgi:hypothetical protein
VTIGCLDANYGRETGKALKKHTVCAARHHWMPSTGHDLGYGEDMLHGGRKTRNCRTSAKTFLISA